MIWTTTKVEDDSEDNQTGYGDNLDRCEYEFTFAIYTCDAYGGEWVSNENGTNRLPSD